MGHDTMDRIRQDLRFAFRQLQLSPGFAVLAVFILALGIGANTGIFSVANDVVMRPLLSPDPHRVVAVGWDRATGPQGASRAHRFEHCREVGGVLPPEFLYVPGSCFPCNSRTLRTMGAKT